MKDSIPGEPLLVFKDVHIGFDEGEVRAATEEGEARLANIARRNAAEAA